MCICADIYCFEIIIITFLNPIQLVCTNGWTTSVQRQQQNNLFPSQGVFELVFEMI